MKSIARPPRGSALIRRVAVGEPLGRRSATLRVWSDPGKSDVYAGLRVIAGSVKVSLHESGQCHAGLTSEFAARHPEVIASLGGGRHQTKWTRTTHVGPRFEVPLQFVFPESELREAPAAASADSGTTWLPAPGTDHAVIVSLGFSGQVVADDQWPGRRNGTQLLNTLVLPNGEKFWLLWQEFTVIPEIAGMLEEAVQHKARTREVVINSREPVATRTLIFKEFIKQRTLTVIEAAI